MLDKHGKTSRWSCLRRRLNRKQIEMSFIDRFKGKKVIAWEMCSKDN